MGRRLEGGDGEQNGGEQAGDGPGAKFPGHRSLTELVRYSEQKL
jgi:hypothetical protein